MSLITISSDHVRKRPYVLSEEERKLEMSLTKKKKTSHTSHNQRQMKFIRNADGRVEMEQLGDESKNDKKVPKIDVELIEMKKEKEHKEENEVKMEMKKEDKQNVKKEVKKNEKQNAKNEVKMQVKKNENERTSQILFKSKKISLKKIIRKEYKERALDKINDAAKRIHNNSVHTYFLIKLYLLDKYERHEPFPVINKDLFVQASKVISENSLNNKNRERDIDKNREKDLDKATSNQKYDIQEFYDNNNYLEIQTLKDVSNKNLHFITAYEADRYLVRK